MGNNEQTVVATGGSYVLGKKIGKTFECRRLLNDLSPYRTIKELTKHETKWLRVNHQHNYC